MTRKFTLVPTTAEDAQTLLQSLEQGAGVYVPSDVVPEVFQEVEVVFSVSDQESSLTGSVVNIPPGGGGFYVHFSDAALLAKVQEELKGAFSPDGEPDPSEAAGEEEGEGNGKAKTRPTPAWDILDPTSSEPIHSQVRKLTVAEKLKIARTCTRPVRELLIRDSEKRIHAEVVKNPKVTDEEIQVYTGMPNLSPRVLDWVSKQPKYMRRRAVLMNIIQNPMTPPDTAKKLIARLNDHELLRITRSSKVREGISRHAKRILMNKGVL